MFVLSVLEAPNTETNTYCVQTHSAIKLFLIMIYIFILYFVSFNYYIMFFGFFVIHVF